MTSSPTQTSPPASTQTEPHPLQCMEVWGGSSAADHSASVPGLDISVSSRPIEGSESGGDLYLISSCSSGWITRILLADVSGHGSDVSDLSNKLRKAMHKSINTVDQSKLAKSLNSSFDAFSEGGKFATALLMTYFAPSGHLIFVNAGHPPPLLKREGSSTWELLDANTPGILRETSTQIKVGIKNLPLGVINTTQYEQLAIKINRGDRVCAYTDAFSESRHPQKGLVGSSGLASVMDQAFNENNLDHAQALLESLDEQGFEKADDDHTLLMLHHNGGQQNKIGMPSVKNFLKSSFGMGHIDTVVQ